MKIQPLRDPILWLGLGASVGPLASAAPLAVGLGVTGASALLLVALLRGAAPCRRRRPLPAALVALVMHLPLVFALVGASLGLVRARARITHHETLRQVTERAGTWPSRCAVSGTVARSPVMLGGGIRVELFPAEVHCRDGPDGSAAGLVRLHLPDEVDAAGIGRGDRIASVATLAPPYRFWNLGASDPRPAEARRAVVLTGGADDVLVTERGRGLIHALDRVRGRLRLRIRATFPPATEGMARALVLGEDDLIEEDQRAFRQSGLAHLLAVSGMHLVLVVMGFVAAVRAALVRTVFLAARFDVGLVAAGLGLPVTWLYVELAGASGSALRAAWMCSVVLIARLLHRHPATWRAFGLSLVLMSARDPLVAFDLSFVLSALATIGILVLARPIETRLRAVLPAAPSFVVTPFATTAAATITSTPILATITPELALGGLVANVIAVPFGEAAALPLCLTHGLVALVPWHAAERGAAIIATGALLIVRWAARTFAWGGLPVPSPTAAELAALGVLGVGLIVGRGRRFVALGLVLLVGLEALARRAGAPKGLLRVTFLDVGQGDSALLDLPDGSALLLDGGGLVGSPVDVGERAVGAVLAARRRTDLAVAVLSHPHPDHFLGLASALRRAPPKELWDTGQGEAEDIGGAYAALLADLRRRGTVIRRPAELCGSHVIGGATIEVLAPCPGVEPDRGPNDNSFVLRVRFGKRTFLFMGDSEREAEADLVGAAASDPSRLRADVLKVGHHGSRTSSSPAFLAAVRPEIAVISCGVRNRFGHPRRETLEALNETRARVYRTDRDGSVIVETDGERLDVASAAGQVRSTTPM